MERQAAKQVLWTSTVLLVCVMIGACTHTMGDKRLEDPSVISQIEKGKTTKQQVQSLIGPPFMVSFNDKHEETWMYMRTKMTTRPTSFIPVVGIFAGGMDTQQTQLTIVFDSNDIVSAVGVGAMTGGGGGLQDLSR